MVHLHIFIQLDCFCLLLKISFIYYVPLNEDGQNKSLKYHILGMLYFNQVISKAQLE